MDKLGENRQSAQAHSLPRAENASPRPTRARKWQPMARAAKKWPENNVFMQSYLIYMSILHF